MSLLTLLRRRNTPALVSLRSKLTSWWTMEEASGTRNDSHGTNHLTDNNTVTRAGGRQAYGAQCTAANTEYLSKTSNSDLQIGNNPRTFVGWFRRDTVGSFVRLIGKEGAQNEYYLAVGANGAVEFTVWSPAGSATSATTPGSTIAVLTWYFVRAWHDPVLDTINVQVNNGTIYSAAFSAGVRTSTNDFRIGGSSTPFNGRLDEWAVFNAVLTTAEATALYNGGAGISYMDLVPASLTPIADMTAWTYPTLFLSRTVPTETAGLVDQTAAGGGDGSVATPYNSVPTATTGAAQRRALKRGQTHPGKIAVSHEDFVLSAYGTGDLPRLTARTTPTWAKTATYTSVYDATVTHDAVSGTEGTYDAVYAVEEDTTSITPVSRLRQMTRVASIAACDALAGSYYISTLSTTSSHVYVHGTDGAAPGTRYAISVTTKYATVVMDVGIDDVEIMGVVADSSIFGYGTVARGENINLHHSILQFGTIHHAVLSGGVVENTALAGSATVAAAKGLTYYVTDAAQTLTGTVRNSLIDRVGDAFYFHTSEVGGSASDWASITLEDTVLVNARNGSSQLVNSAFGGQDCQLVTMDTVVLKDFRDFGLNVKAAVIDRLFAWGYQRSVWTPGTAASEILIRDSIFIGADGGYGGGAEGNSYLMRQGGATGKLHLQHCLIIVPASAGVVSQVSGFNIEYTHCIFVNAYSTPTALDVATSVNVQSGAGALGLVADNNLYISLYGGSWQWSVTNQASGGPNQTLSTWQAQSLQDANSIEIQSANGLTSLFRDWTAGNLQWGYTPLGQMVAALVAASGYGPATLPTRWPTIPTADDAHAALVANTAIAV